MIKLGEKEVKFLLDLSEVSGTLTIWARQCLFNGWELEELKKHIKLAMKIVEKQR